MKGTSPMPVVWIASIFPSYLLPFENVKVFSMEKHCGSQNLSIFKFYDWDMPFSDSYTSPQDYKTKFPSVFFYYCSGFDPSENFCYNEIWIHF